MEKRIAEIISQMTLEEKALLLSGSDFWHTKALKRFDIPSISVSDGPFGLRKVKNVKAGLDESYPATCFPTTSALACSFNETLLYQTGKAMGVEARDQDVDVILGPGLNIKRSPLCGRNFEYFSEDPYLLGKLASAMIKGIQSTGVAACAKHYAVNSQERKRLMMNAIVDERALREIYLKGFEIVVKEASPMTMMCAYNQVNGRHASRNKYLLTDILRNEWGYRGLMMTDWGAMVTPADSVLAGLDLEMPGGTRPAKEILTAIKQGTLPMNKLDVAVGRILRLVLKLQEKPEKPVCDYDVHHQLAKTVADECSVLLKNDEHILPMKKDAHVAVIGGFAKTMRYQGAGSSKILPTKLDNAYDALLEAGVKFDYAEGYHRHKQDIDPNLIDEALAIAKDKDLVLIFAGLPESYESEGFDRENMLMPKSHTDLIEEVAKVNANVVVVLSAGAPVNMFWYPKVKGILMGYLLGQAGGKSIVDILLGKVNPSGKLAESFPYYTNDTPAANFFSKRALDIEYRESVFVGYRYYEASNKFVQFPFGFGLSYSNFSLSDFEVSASELNEKIPVTIRLKVTNLGPCDGAEVVQCYLGQNNPVIFKPVKELRRFEKVFLKVNESKVITFKLDKEDFTYYNTHIKNWAIESGSYTIYVGNSSDNTPLKSTVTFNALNIVKPIDYRQSAPGYYAMNRDVLDIRFREFEAVYEKDITHVPDQHTRPFTLNNCLADAKGYRTGRFIIKVLNGQITKMANGDENQEALIRAVALDTPLRSVTALTSGQISINMAEGIVDFMNGRPLRGILKILKKKPASIDQIPEQKPNKKAINS